MANNSNESSVFESNNFDSIPRDVFSLVESLPAKFHFPFPGWDIQFGRYKWFYIKGFLQFLYRVGVYTGSELSNYKDRAVLMCPKEWIDKFPHGEWGSISSPQIYHAIRGSPLRFDKACLMFLIVEAVIRKNSYDVEMINYLYKSVKISPALFVVDGSESIFKALHPSAFEDISVHTNQSASFIYDVLRYQLPVTYSTAEALVGFFIRRGFDRCRVRMLRDRTDKGKLFYKAPAGGEILESSQ